MLILLKDARLSHLLCKNNRRDYVLILGAKFVSQSPNQGSKTILYILGISVGLGLLFSAFVFLLLGTGIIKQIPQYVTWAIILFSVGIGILSGVTMSRR